MRTGEVEANLLRLNDVFALPHVDELIARKTAGLENDAVTDADLSFHDAEYRRLTADLESARERTTLPDAPTTRPALNDLLIRLRLEGG